MALASLMAPQWQRSYVLLLLRTPTYTLSPARCAVPRCCWLLQALWGINLPLGFIGQEWVWLQTYTALGVPAANITDEWMSGPAFLPWCVVSAGSLCFEQHGVALF